MPEKNQTEQKAGRIVSLLQNSYTRLLRRKRLVAATVFCAVLLAGFGLIVLIEAASYLSATAKILSFSFLIIAALVVSFFINRRCSLPGFETFYQNLFTQNGRKEALSAVDLYLDEKQKSSRFYDAALASNMQSLQLRELSDEARAYTSQLDASRQFRFSSAGLAGSFLIFAFIILSMPAETARTLHFWNSYTPSNPFAYSITPADTTVEHGSSIQAKINFRHNRVPENIIFEYKTDVEDSYRERQMRPTENGTFISPEIDLTNTISYRIEMDGFLSEEYLVNVQLQPRFDELAATVHPPSYTGLSDNRIEYPFSQINLYLGSTVDIEGITNKPLKQLSIQASDESAEMRAENGNHTIFTATLAPEKTDTISFKMIDYDELTNRNPFRTIVNVREDQYPVVVIQEPTGTLMESNPDQLDIIYQATDDFGLTRAELQWQHQRAFVEETGTGAVSLNRPGNGRNEQFSWDLDEFELRPRDQLVFKIRVWDNDEISGYKWSDSQEVVIQIPSLTEYFDELDGRERDVQGELDDISDSFRDMEEEFEQFLERLRQNPDRGFEEEQMLEDIRERQQNIDEAIQEMNDKFNEIREEMQQNDRVSEETQRAYQELQELMAELDDPALREALEELQRAIENMSQQELERALEDVSFNEDLYRERLERTVELFKRLKMNSDLDKLASQYEDMAERLQNEEERSVDQLSNEMENIREDLNNVAEQLEQLDANPPARSEERLQELKEAGQQELENIREQLEQLMEEAGRQQEEGDGSPSEEMQQQQEQLSQQMQQESERFRSSIQEMGGEQIQVNILALQRALYTLLELSNMQEYLTQTSADTRNRSHGFIELARVQKNVSDQFSTVADTLFQVSSELPGVPNQINRKKAEIEQTLGRTLNEMIERNQRGSAITTRESLGGINDLTSMIATLIDQLMDQQNGGGSGGGMSMQQMVEQLQNMSGDQQQLNQQLQDLINDAQGDRLTREQSERLDQLARQQNEIRRQLEELQRSGALEQGDRTLSELQRMLEEMEDSINDMRGGITDPLMVQRQQNILSRMLNAEESLQQRGEDEAREGTTVQDYDRVLPPDITLEELQQEIRARMQDPNYTRFSEEYQRLIERYFEQLRNMEELQMP